MDQSTYLQRRRYKVASYGQQGSDASNRYLDRNGSYHTATVAGRALDDTDGYCCEPPTVPEPVGGFGPNLAAPPAPPAPAAPLALFYDAALYSGSGSVPNSAPGGADESGSRTNVTHNSGIVGGVFDFPGNGYINFGTYDFGNLITVCAWIYPRTKVNINGLLSTRGAGGESIGGFTFGWNNYNTSSLADLAICSEMSNGSAMEKPSTVNGIITIGSWQHIAYVFDNTANTLLFYKNGVEQAVTGTACPPNVITNKDFKIGSFQDGNFGMNAQLASLKVFSSILNATDIFNDYNTTKSRFGL